MGCVIKPWTNIVYHDLRQLRGEDSCEQALMKTQLAFWLAKGSYCT